MCIPLIHMYRILVNCVLVPWNVVGVFAQEYIYSRPTAAPSLILHSLSLSLIQCCSASVLFDDIKGGLEGDR